MEIENDDLFDDLYDEKDDEYNDYGDEEQPDNIVAGFREETNRVDDQLLDINIDTSDPHYRMKIDAKTTFSLRLLEVLRDYDDIFKFDINDLEKIKLRVHTLPMIEYKNAYAFAMGYFVALNVRRNLDIMDQYIKNGVINRAMLLKYARYWLNE